MNNIKTVSVSKPDDWDTNPLYQKTYKTEPSKANYNEKELIEHINQNKQDKLNEITKP